MLLHKIKCLKSLYNNRFKICNQSRYWFDDCSNTIKSPQSIISLLKSHIILNMINQSELPHWVGKSLPKSDPPCHDFHLCTWYDNISSSHFHSNCHGYSCTDCSQNPQVCICDQTPPPWYNYFCRYLCCCLSYMCRSRSCRDYCNYLRLFNLYMTFDSITKFKSFLRSESNILISSSLQGCH